MADVVTLGDVSTKDTGSGSQLKTGGRRKHNMAQKCETGTVWSLELKKCVPEEKPKHGPPGKEGQYKYKSPKQRMREYMGTGKRYPGTLSEKFPKGKFGKGKKLTKKEIKKLIY